MLSIEEAIRAKIKEFTMFNVKVELLDEGTITHQGKPKRVIDLRQF